MDCALYRSAGRLPANNQCSDPNKEGPRNGWECSLRIRYDDSPEPVGGKPVEGLHHDQWGHLLFAIQYHYLTIVLYIIYVALLHLAFSKGNKKKRYMNKFQCRIALGLLLIVQISIFSFAIITRESSEMSEVKVIP